MSVESTSDTAVGVRGDGAPAAPRRGEMNTVIPRRHPGRWIAVGIIAILAAQAVQVVLTNPNFHWDVFGEYLFHAQVLRGVRWTLLLTVLAMALAIVLAGALVAMRDSDNPGAASGPRTSWIWFFRRHPDLHPAGVLGTLRGAVPRACRCRSRSARNSSASNPSCC